MKKITLLFLFMWTVWGFAQAKRYTFSQTVGAYTEIAGTDTGVTILGDSNSDTQYFVDPANLKGGPVLSGTGFTIGFNFVLNGTTYDRFGVSADGWISLGTSGNAKVGMTVANANSPLSTITSTAAVDTQSSRIAGLANDLMAQQNASLLYQLQGASPNRVLVVQWKNYRKKTNGAGDSFNFQIRLKETSNVVEIAYGNFSSNANALTFQVGLRAEPAVEPANFSNRTNNWSNTQSGTAVTDGMILSDQYVPTSGLTFDWTPPTCTAVNAITANEITTTSAFISWSAYGPLPSGYEYVVSTSPIAPSGSGTATSTSTVRVTGLAANTNYYAFVRTNCATPNNEFTPWEAVAFKTGTEKTSFFETFDAYATSVGIVPDGWSKTGSASTAIVEVRAGGKAPGTPPNQMVITIPASNPAKYACLMMPAVSNLQNNTTNRLRFKGVNAGSGNSSVEIGYFTDAAATIFVPIDSKALTATFTEYTVDIPSNIPDTVRSLVFRVTSFTTTGAIGVSIDDVALEPIPSCANVSALTATYPTNNSVKINWTNGGTETQWQYVYGLNSSVINPYEMSPIDVPQGTLPGLPISGLQASTQYKIWVRSVCSPSGYGNWVGPLTFSTLCDSSNRIFENFDGSANLPSCWINASGGTNVSLSTSVAGIPFPLVGAPNKILLNGGAKTAVIVLPPLTNLKDGTNQLKFNMAAAAANVKLEIGYVDDATNADTFHSFQQDITSTDAHVSSFLPVDPINLGTAAQSNYLAFRVATGGTIYIDDVVWEPKPSIGCSAISEITAKAVTNNTAKLQWKHADAETQWQYAMGSAADTDPYSLVAKDFTGVDQSKLGTTGYVSSIMQGLTPFTVYKIWIRSKCGDGIFGAYIGPYTIKTTCDPIDHFAENFDTAVALPTCWTTSGFGTTTVGPPTVGSVKALSAPCVLSLTGSTTKDCIVALPAVSNASGNTHRLTFQYRSNTATGGTLPLELGYLTNQADRNSFVKVDLPSVIFPPTTTYQTVVALLGDAPQTSVLAFRYKSGITIYIDNVVWEPIPSCANVANLSVPSVTHNSIDVMWEKSTSSETKWEYVIGDSTVSDPLNLTPIEVVGNAQDANGHVSITQVGTTALQPETTYKIWVRSKCFDDVTQTYMPGSYVPVIATTSCAPANELNENFEGEQGAALPHCWKKVGSQGYAFIQQALVGDKSKKLYSVTYYTNPSSQPVVALPPVNMGLLDNHILRFKLSGSNGSQIEIGFLTDVSDPTSFVSKKTYTAISLATSQIIVVDKNDLGGTALSNTLAFRNPGVQGMDSQIYIDDVTWAQAPTTPPSCVTASAVIDQNCGNYKTTISWQGAADADGYKLSVGKTTGIYDTMESDLGNTLSYDFIGDSNTTYYYTVTPYNYAGSPSHAGCPEYSFTTKVNTCYCVSSPTSVDGGGITILTLGETDFIPSDTNYNDFSNQPVSVAQVGNVNLKYSFDTNFIAYNTSVWIDFNNDLQFDDDNEKVFSGVSSIDFPNKLDATFAMPVNTALGVYRMRIGAKASGNAEPCYNGTKGETVDFTINVVSAVANDNPSGAITLITGKTFDENAIDGTNTNSTGSYQETAPACGDYSGADVWYKATVPATGNITFEVNSISGGLLNTAAAAYSGTPGNLVQIVCDDSSSTASVDQPKISLTGRTAGEVLYFRVWENGGDEYGTFKVSAYDSTEPILGNDVFEMNKFTFYPNPVKDILNVSSDKEISIVTVTNLLGQTVMTKSINADKSTIDMAGLTAGAYFLKVSIGNESKVIKFIKE